MAKVFTHKRVFLNPSEKSRKYAQELKQNVKMTNDGVIKTGQDGKPMALTESERGYLSGYLSARRDSADMYNYRNALDQGKTVQEARALSFGASRKRRQEARRNKERPARKKRKS